MAYQEIYKNPSTQIRVPATANLMIDSADRIYDLSGTVPVYTRYPTPFDFQIDRPQALLNGFFTRIATSEVALEWNIPNISPQLSNNNLQFQVDASTFTATFPQGFYTVQEVLQALPVYMNNVAGGAAFSTVATTVFEGSERALINLNQSTFTISPSKLADTLFTQTDQLQNTSNKPYFQAIDLRPLRYIDFVSEDLTYNQSLKDSSTAKYPRDVLNRWYFDWDTPPILDGFGYPILMGYTPFYTRRLYNPPKQIKWEPNMPLGNNRFQLYDNNGQLMTYLNTPGQVNSGNGVNKTNWLMTLQVSEN